MEKISVILCTYNEPYEMIVESISSILCQTYSYFELILINDNPTRTDLNNQLFEISSTDARVKYIKNEENIGLVKSLNKGICLSTGEFIARMDADDVSYKNRLEMQLDFIKKSGCDIVGCNVDKIDENGNYLGEILLPTENKKIKKYMRYGSCVLHPTWLVRKGVYIKLGGYRNIPTCEDFDFLLRAINSSFILGNMQQKGLKYRIRNTSISQTFHIKQKLIMYYEIKEYKSGKNTKIEDLEYYISSDQYKKDYNKLLKYDGAKAIVESDASHLKEKLFSFFYMLTNKYFLQNIIEHLKMKERIKYSC